MADFHTMTIYYLRDVYGAGKKVLFEISGSLEVDHLGGIGWQGLQHVLMEIQ